jgi:RimJ/RimL family protein N-acetyltransferase
MFSDWYSKEKHVGEIGLVLLKPWRDRGIGSAMLDYAIEWAHQVRLEKVTASVMATNHRALNIFYKANFIQEGRLAQQYKINGEYIDEVVLSLFL